MRRRRSAGFALLAALWGLALLGFLAAALSGAARTEAKIARNQSVATQAQAAADGGVRLAVARLAAPGDTMRRDGAPWTYAVGDATVTVSVVAAGGLVDLNAAPPALLAAAFRAAGETPEAAARQADRVADWRDADDDRRPHGAEAADYAAPGAVHGLPPPANRRFEALVELKRTLGVDPGLYVRVLPFITLQSRRPGVDPRLAPPPLLRALPAVDPRAVEALLAGRPLSNETAIRELGLPAELTASATGDVLEIHAVARLPEGRQAGRRATLRLTGMLADPAWLHAWEETP